MSQPSNLGSRRRLTDENPLGMTESSRLSIRPYVEAAVRLVKPDGTVVGHDIWSKDVLTRALADRLASLGIPNVYDRMRLIREAIVYARQHSGSGDAYATFEARLSDRAKAHSMRPLRTFRLVLPMFISGQVSPPFQRMTVLGVPIRRSEWRHLNADANLRKQWREKVDHWWKLDGHRDLEFRFALLEAKTEAQDAIAAFERGFPAYQMLRVALNLQSEWGTAGWQSGVPQPLGKIRPAPLYGVYDDGAGQLEVFVHSERLDYTFPPTGFSFDRARRLIARLERIGAPALQSLIRDALLKYSEALDTVQWRQAFLALWQILELLALQAKNQMNMATVTSRISALLGAGLEIKGLLDALVDTRNKLVHAGSFPDSDGHQEVMFLKSVAEQAIDSVLWWARHLDRKDTLLTVYESLTLPESVLLEHRRVVSAILRRRLRRHKSAAKQR